MISPNRIYRNFYHDLNKLFLLKKIEYFQLRLKDVHKNNIIYVGKRIKKICKKHKVKFIINDSPKIAKILDADGCHLGQSDTSIKTARKLLKNKIIGITCHNSIKLIKNATASGADYIAIGAFFYSNTKKISYKCKLSFIKKAKSITKLPLITIGGISNSNYKNVVLHNPNFLAISGYIWNNKKYKPLEALKKIKL